MRKSRLKCRLKENVPPGKLGPDLVASLLVDAQGNDTETGRKAGGHKAATNNFLCIKVKAAPSRTRQLQPLDFIST